MHTIRRVWLRICSVAVLSAMLAGEASATVVPFTEDFTSDGAEWYDAPSTAVLTWRASGGPDGGAYASTNFNFVGSAAADTPAVFRGQDGFDSSGDAFVGDWLTDGVSEFRAFVRHDAGTDLRFFTRFASPFNFPAMVAVVGTPVASGTWTEFVIPIQPGGFIPEGPSTFNGVFGNLGNVQLGVIAEPLAGVDQVVTFDLDKPSIIPEPATFVLMGLGTCVVLARRRARRSVP